MWSLVSGLKQKISLVPISPSLTFFQETLKKNRQNIQVNGKLRPNKGG
jgi:hypothetical protein